MLQDTQELVYSPAVSVVWYYSALDTGVSRLSLTSQFWEVVQVSIWSTPTRAVGVSLR